MLGTYLDARIFAVIVEIGAITGADVHRTEALTRELADVSKDFDAWITRELPRINADLAKKNLQAIQPITRDQWDKNTGGGQSTAATTDGRDRFERD